MCLGMLAGSDGLLHISYANYELSEQICSAALIFIMFYGGFNLNWKAAKPVAGRSVLLSTLGVVITAAVTAILLHLLFKISYTASFLIAAVLSSTDAASVFSVLRRSRLNLRGGIAPMIELESGSNDPVSYMLTGIAVSLLLTGQTGNIFLLLLSQIGFGIVPALVCAWVVIELLKKRSAISAEFAPMFLVGMMLLCYGISSVLEGNAYLAVYLMGILTGNASIHHKKELIAFYDGLTSLAQILIFFLLGLLSFPARLPEIFGFSLSICLILLLAARPAAVFLILLPFGASWQECIFVSLAGLRGAASCVFAIMAVASGANPDGSLFLIVYVVTILSVSLQGMLLPEAAKLLGLIDNSEDVRRTFNDYSDLNEMHMIRIPINKSNPWTRHKIKDLQLPEGVLALMIEREQLSIACKGNTVLEDGDQLVLSVPAFRSEESEELQEITLEKGHPWIDRPIHALPLGSNTLIALLLRDGNSIYPGGNTVLKENDRLVLFEGDLPKISGQNNKAIHPDSE